MAKTKKQVKNKSNKKKVQPTTTLVVKPNLSALVMKACSVTNPFCEEAIGARWPDNSYTRSIGWSITGYPITLSTNTDKVANLFVPGVYNRAVPTDTPPYTNTYNFNALTSLGLLPSDISRWRITSWGLKISAISTPMNSSGMVRIRLVSPMDGVSLQNLSAWDPKCDAAYDIPLARLLNKDAFIIPSPLGENARLFRISTPGTIATWENPGWQCVLVAVDGGPASAPVIQITAYVNFEFVFHDQSGYNQFAQPAPANNPVVQAANASIFTRVGNFLEGSAQTVDKVFNSKAAQYLLAAGASYATKSPAPLMIAAQARNVD